MSRGIRSSVDVEVFTQAIVRDFVVVAEKPADLLGGCVGVSDRIDLRTIARREDDDLPSRAARRQLGEGVLESLAGEVDRLPQFYRGCAVTQSDGKEAHQVTVIRNCGSRSENIRRARN